MYLRRNPEVVANGRPAKVEAIGRSHAIGLESRPHKAWGSSVPLLMMNMIITVEKKYSIESIIRVTQFFHDTRCH